MEQVQEDRKSGGCAGGGVGWGGGQRPACGYTSSQSFVPLPRAPEGPRLTSPEEAVLHSDVGRNMGVTLYLLLLPQGAKRLLNIQQQYITSKRVVCLALCPTHTERL